MSQLIEDKTPMCDICDFFFWLLRLKCTQGNFKATKNQKEHKLGHWMISQTGVLLEDLFQLTGDNWALIFVPPFTVELTASVTSSFFPPPNTTASLYGEV